MSKLDGFFKFKVNEVVKSSVMRLGEKMPYFQIVERLIQECPGGIQYHYKCRHLFDDGGISTNYIQLNEIEVQACDLEEDIKAFDKAQVEREFTNYRELERMKFKFRKELRKEAKAEDTSTDGNGSTDEDKTSTE